MWFNKTNQSTVTYESSKCVHPTEHFEECPISNVPITRKPTLEEIQLHLGGEFLTRQLINYFRYLDGVKPLNWETKDSSNIYLEYARFYHYTKDKDFIKSLEEK